MESIKWNRRIVKIKGTFYIALPLPWAESNKLNKREEIKMELEQDGSLRISPGGRK
jgi:hypothetical protein